MTALSPENAGRLRLAFQQSREMEATLGQQLQTYAAAAREIFPAYAEAVDRLVRRIRENGAGEQAPKPGDLMPPFVLPDENGRMIELQSLLVRGPVALMFYRGHWCPYCRLQASAVIRASDRISDAGGQLIAVTPEVQQFSRRFKSESGGRFPVLTDLDNGFALSLNLAIWLGAEIPLLLSHLDMAAFHGNDGWLLPIPATFVVGRDGVIKARYLDPDFRKRMEIDDLVDAVTMANREG